MSGALGNEYAILEGELLVGASQICFQLETVIDILLIFYYKLRSLPYLVLNYKSLQLDDFKINRTMQYVFLVPIQISSFLELNVTIKRMILFDVLFFTHWFYRNGDYVLS